MDIECTSYYGQDQLKPILFSYISLDVIRPFAVFAFPQMHRCRFHCFRDSRKFRADLQLITAPLYLRNDRGNITIRGLLPLWGIGGKNEAFRKQLYYTMLFRAHRGVLRARKEARAALVSSRVCAKCNIAVVKGRFKFN